MAEICVFCGKKLSFFASESLTCGSVSQPICPECYPEAAELSFEERAQRALDTGRAKQPETIRAYLEQRKEMLREMTQKQEQKRQKQMTDKACLRCGKPMLNLGKQTFQTMGNPHTLTAYTSLFELEILRCEDCGKVEFFMPEQVGFTPFHSPLDDMDMVTCPVCGHEHSPLVGCPTCALRQASGGISSGQHGLKKKHEKKPPWEK